MSQTHTPKIRKPTDEELDAAIRAAEFKGWYGLLGALLDYKQLRVKDRPEVLCKTS